MDLPAIIKPKVILALLIVLLVANAFSLFLITHIDTIVNGDLYSYGLQFSYGWAGEYWANLQILIVSLSVGMILASISFISFLTYARNRNSVSALLCFFFLVTTTGLLILSVFLFNSLDYIVNNNLYLYGLRFSIIWASTYWNYARSLLALIGVAGATAFMSALLVVFKASPSVRNSPAKLTSSLLIATGLIAFAFSAAYNSSTLALVGLGLLFWGITFSYIRSEEYAKKILLKTAASSQIATLNQIVRELKYEGDAVYLPPQYFSNPGIHKAYLPERKGFELPTPDQIREHENDFLIEKPSGALLVPPGSELTTLFEKTLHTSFARVDLQYLQRHLPKLFTEDLEIAQSFKMETETNTIRIRIGNSIYGPLNVGDDQQSAINSTLGSPISSAIACAIAKATRKPIVMQEELNSENGRDVAIEYRILN
jgi:hypothetical protein